MAGFKVLVTGFGRYGNTKTNPARAVVQDVQKLFSLESGLITDSFSDLAGLPKPDVDVAAPRPVCSDMQCHESRRWWRWRCRANSSPVFV